MMVAAAAATATFPFSIFHCKLPKATNAARSLWFLCSFCGPSVLPCAFCYLLFGSSHSSLLATVYGGVFAVPSIKPGRLCFCFCPCIGPAAVFSFLFFFARTAYTGICSLRLWHCPITMTMPLAGCWSLAAFGFGPDIKTQRKLAKYWTLITTGWKFEKRVQNRVNLST